MSASTRIIILITIATITTVIPDPVYAQSAEQEAAFELLTRRGLVQNRSIDGAELANQAAAGNIVNLQLLLAAGVPPDAEDHEGLAALLKAVDQDQIEAVRILIDAGADLEARDRIGRTAFVIATQRGYLDILHLLLAAKAEAGDTE